METLLTKAESIMVGRLTELGSQIVTKDKEAVKTLLGRPLKISYWTMPDLDPDADAATIAAFKAATLDEIWIYTSGRVHFSLAGIAIKVDDKVGPDIPPPQYAV